jgi:hypothetical protein
MADRSARWEIEKVRGESCLRPLSFLRRQRNPGRSFIFHLPGPRNPKRQTGNPLKCPPLLRFTWKILKGHEKISHPEIIHLISGEAFGSNGFILTSIRFFNSSGDLEDCQRKVGKRFVFEEIGIWPACAKAACGQKPFGGVGPLRRRQVLGDWCF